ncbi:MAG: hypothetical protein ACYCQI_13545 [Gammaproteobacteria bacterium]
MLTRIEKLTFIFDEVVGESSYQMGTSYDQAIIYSEKKHITDEHLNIIVALLQQRDSIYQTMLADKKEKVMCINPRFNKCVENYLDEVHAFSKLDPYSKNPFFMFEKAVCDPTLMGNIQWIGQKHGTTEPSFFNRLPRELNLQILAMSSESILQQDVIEDIVDRHMSISRNSRPS